jgi:hypothetical protein
MFYRIVIFFLFYLLSNELNAQRILYSPFIGNLSDIKFEVIGKAGTFYWVQKSKKKNRTRKKTEAGVIENPLSFEIYDGRMNLIKTISPSVAGPVLKEYFVPGEQYMDQLVLANNNDSTSALLNRYTDEGTAYTLAHQLCSFPPGMVAGDFLLIRSQDKNKILLLGFESVPDSAPRIHSYLFDKNWKQIHFTILKDRRITQPFIQYDLVDYPLEHFTNASVKLANNGEWLMLSSARINNGNLLFHFRGDENRFELKELRLPKNATVQDVVLSINNEKREVLAGVLSQYRTALTKTVRMLHYSLDTCKVLYDSAYRFTTVAAKKNTTKTIYEEYFMAVPDKGFLLLKEYGKAYDNFSDGELTSNDDDGPLSFNTSAKQFYQNKNDYTRYNNLAGTKELYDRGDLSMYYFSATGKDSCWSGIINKEQSTELNRGNLSYVFLPSDDKLFFLYNSFRSSNHYSSSTILDINGNPLNEGLVYWNIRSTLLFQKARQISDKEIAVPYERNAGNGFAIVKL